MCSCQHSSVGDRRGRGRARYPSPIHTLSSFSPCYSVWGMNLSNTVIMLHLCLLLLLMRTWYQINWEDKSISLFPQVLLPCIFIMLLVYNCQSYTASYLSPDFIQCPVLGNALLLPGISHPQSHPCLTLTFSVSRADRGGSISSSILIGFLSNAWTMVTRCFYPPHTLGTSNTSSAIVFLKGCHTKLDIHTYIASTLLS